jgi:hypothetical protein
MQQIRLDSTNPPKPSFLFQQVALPTPSMPFTYAPSQKLDEAAVTRYTLPAQANASVITVFVCSTPPGDKPLLQSRPQAESFSKVHPNDA